MHHSILGPGGVGGLMAGFLARSGEEVTLVVRPDSLRSYPSQLQIESHFGNFTVPIERAAVIPPCDVLWIAVKATQLEEALRSMPNPDTAKIIVPLLNGIDHVALLRERFGAERVIAATIAGEVERVAPGHIVHRGPFVRLNVSARGKQHLAGTLDQLSGSVSPVSSSQRGYADVEQACLSGPARPNDLGGARHDRPGGPRSAMGSRTASMCAGSFRRGSR
jgi:2-dehydropantoate 2-reductase